MVRRCTGWDGFGTNLTHFQFSKNKMIHRFINKTLNSYFTMGNIDRLVLFLFLVARSARDKHEKIDMDEDELESPIYLYTGSCKYYLFSSPVSVF